MKGMAGQTGLIKLSYANNILIHSLQKNQSGNLAVTHVCMPQMKSLRMSRNKQEDIKKGSLYYACTGRG